MGIKNSTIQFKVFQTMPGSYCNVMLLMITKYETKWYLVTLRQL